MKIIQEGSMFSIHSDDIKTHDKLPAAFYEVLFNPKAGYADYEFTLVTIDTTGATPVYDLELSANVIPASKLKLNWYKERTKEEDEDDKAYNEQLRAFKAKTPLYVVFKLKYSQRSYHYYDF